MMLTIRILGAEVLHISTEPDTEEAEYDPAIALSGGTLGVATEIDPGSTDRYMGFTNGRDE